MPDVLHAYKSVRVNDIDGIVDIKRITEKFFFQSSLTMESRTNFLWRLTCICTIDGSPCTTIKRSGYAGTPMESSAASILQHG
jgi:hypothetical protein